MGLLDNIFREIPEELLKYPKGKYFDYTFFENMASTTIKEESLNVNTDINLKITQNKVMNIYIKGKSYVSLDINKDSTFIGRIKFDYDSNIKLRVSGGKFLLIFENLPRYLEIRAFGNYGGIIINSKLENNKEYTIIGRLATLNTGDSIDLIANIINGKSTSSSISFSGLSFGNLSIRVLSRLLGQNSCSKTSITIFNFNKASALPLLDIANGDIKCAEHKSAIYNMNENVMEYLIHKGINLELFKKVLLKDFIDPKT